MKLLVVPLDGSVPFILKPLFGEGVRRMALSEDCWVIDLEDGTALVQDPENESELIWRPLEVKT